MKFQIIGIIFLLDISLSLTLTKIKKSKHLTKVKTPTFEPNPVYDYSPSLHSEVRVSFDEGVTFKNGKAKFLLGTLFLEDASHDKYSIFLEESSSKIIKVKEKDEEFTAFRVESYLNAIKSKSTDDVQNESSNQRPKLRKMLTLTLAIETPKEINSAIFYIPNENVFLIQKWNDIIFETFSEKHKHYFEDLYSIPENQATSRGYFGKVFIGLKADESANDLTKYAIKRLKIGNIEKDGKLVNNELKILQTLKDSKEEYAIELIDIYFNINYVYIITPFYEKGNLRDYSRNNLQFVPLFEENLIMKEQYNHLASRLNKIEIQINYFNNTLIKLTDQRNKKEISSYLDKIATTTIEKLSEKIDNLKAEKVEITNEMDNLYNTLNKNDKTRKEEEKKIANIIHQILEGVNHLHKMRIIHRDLKMDNI